MTTDQDARQAGKVWRPEPWQGPVYRPQENDSIDYPRMVGNYGAPRCWRVDQKAVNEKAVRLKGKCNRAGIQSITCTDLDFCPTSLLQFRKKNRADCKEAPRKQTPKGVWAVLSGRVEKSPPWTPFSRSFCVLLKSNHCALLAFDIWRISPRDNRERCPHHKELWGNGGRLDKRGEAEGKKSWPGYVHPNSQDATWCTQVPTSITNRASRSGRSTEEINTRQKRKVQTRRKSDSCSRTAKKDEFHCSASWFQEKKDCKWYRF